MNYILLFVVLGALVLYWYNTTKTCHTATAAQNEPYFYVPGEQKTRVHFLQGVHDPVNNPHGNPMPYDGYTAVRSKRRQVDVGNRNFYKDLYKSSSEIHQDLFQYPIPDPTHMARQPYWLEDPRPDIASSEYELETRWGTQGTNTTGLGGPIN